MGFSVGGLVSGIDTDSVISQLIELERQPITKLQAKQAAYEVKLTAYGSLQSALSTLRTAASALDSASDMNAYTGVSSDTDAFSASVFSTARSGAYNISVESLAQVHKVKSAAFGAHEAVGAGTFTLQLGEGTSVEITTNADDTLADVANLINEKQKDIQASVITDGDKVYLTLTGQSTGEANTIRLEVTAETPSDPEDTGDVTDETGLSRLLFVAGGDNNHLTETQAASDAILTVDGVEGIHRSTNTVGDVIKGVTLTLKGTTETGKTETLTVSRDTEAIASKVNAFVDAYNAVVDFFKDAQSYDSETEKAGSLLGDGTTNQIRRKLRNMVADMVPGAAEGLNRLSDLGIAMNKEGRLEVDSTVLNGTLKNNFSGVAAFFTTKSGENKGFGVRLVNALDGILNTNDGDLTVRTKGIQTSIDRIDEDIEKYETRVSNTETRLKTQFQNLETLLAQYQKTGDFLTQQIESWQNSNK
ncbi:flagellar filament capping protein FliD [Desulforhabdus amnigena]|jgi:flagellar hook-associated protein 2|uniref:Flagellar hook-associated protein 2 n=1 Tax=Desulforhabdus amnigena TaxID=40218 RepID=A0A9W6FTC3_9BACT|nr:flagellar filament capping protein FliD [Desulforhabdus amnigena]NLJ27079.1 flagellar filament capping protein FliD [Deltaproteobacteria bacterium]GLI33530.1 flagellar hook-associated protein 2 [Desulforhabdus amnigena]